MTKTKGGVLAFMALAAVVATASAQSPTSGPRTPNVEVIMSLRERLELGEEQVAALDAIRRESVERRSADAAEMAEMRSRLRAGSIRQSDMMAYLEERRDAARGTDESLSDRVASVLTEAQLETVQELGARGRAFARGRPGERGFRPARPSFRDRGARMDVRRGARPEWRRGVRGARRAPRW